jgi:hypothetical protein
LASVVVAVEALTAVPVLVLVVAAAGAFGVWALEKEAVVKHAANAAMNQAVLRRIMTLSWVAGPCFLQARPTVCLLVASARNLLRTPASSSLRGMLAKPECFARERPDENRPADTSADRPTIAKT